VPQTFVDLLCVVATVPKVVEPEVLAKQLRRGAPVPKKVFEGTYSVYRREVFVEVELHYARVYFQLLITNSDDGFVGNFNTLRILSHASSALVGGAQQALLPPGVVPFGSERVEHRLPQNCDMQFWRYWNWTASPPPALAPAAVGGAPSAPPAASAKAP